MDERVVVTERIKHVVREYDLDGVRLPGKDVEEKIQQVSEWMTKDRENRYLIIVTQLGSCFFILYNIWNIIFFQNISTHTYILKLLKHIFYLKSDFKVF